MLNVRYSKLTLTADFDLFIDLFSAIFTYEIFIQSPGCGGGLVVIVDMKQRSPEFESRYFKAFLGYPLFPKIIWRQSEC